MVWNASTSKFLDIDQSLESQQEPKLGDKNGHLCPNGNEPVFSLQSTCLSFNYTHLLVQFTDVLLCPLNQGLHKGELCPFSLTAIPLGPSGAPGMQEILPKDLPYERWETFLFLGLFA